MATLHPFTRAITPSNMENMQQKIEENIFSLLLIRVFLMRRVFIIEGRSILMCQFG